MKLLVCGSRTITNETKVFEELDDYLLSSKIDTIICGGADGVDTLAIDYAFIKKIEIVVIDPDYEKHGSRAPLLRDAAMVKMCDKCLAIWDGKSAGTKFTINECINAKKDIKIVYELSTRSQETQNPLKEGSRGIEGWKRDR